MRIAISLIVLLAFVAVVSAQENPPKKNSVQDFRKRPLEDTLTALRSKDSDVRQSAAQAFTMHDSLPDSSIPELVKILQDKESEYRTEMAYALGRMGARARVAVPALRVTLKDRSLDLRVATALSLRRIAPREPVLSVLIEGIEATKPFDRYRAVRELGDMGGKAKDAVLPLRKRLKNEDVRFASAGEGEIRVEVGRALWLISRDPAALPVLLEGARSSVVGERRKAIEYLGLPGLDGKSVMPVLLDTLKDKDWHIRGNGALAMGTVDAKIEERVAFLQTAMKDRHVGVRQMAVQGLGRIGPAARAAVPLLVATLKDRESSLHWWVLETLAAIGPGAAASTPAVGEMPRDKDRQVQLQALFALLKIGPEARKALPIIREMLTDTDPRFRHLAAATAWRVGDASKARSLFLDALKSNNPATRISAVLCLGEVGPVAKEVAPLLRPFLRDADSQMRLVAARSLWHIIEDKSSLALMIVLLEDKQASVREATVECLAEIGPAAKKAIPALKRAEDDEDARVQRRASEALRKIAPDQPKP